MLKEGIVGLFSKLFALPSGIEKQLEDQYIPMFQMMMGMPSSQAKSTFRDMLKQAREESLKEGTSRLPQNFGNVLLEQESTDKKIKAMLTKKRREDVRNEDIRWWWNMHDLERRMMLKVDDITRMAMFTDNLEKGMKEDDAAARVRKCHPMYGDPEDTSNTTGEDRPLLYELKDRVNIYIEKMTQNSSEEYKKEVEESPTFNALIRKEIRKGNI